MCKARCDAPRVVWDTRGVRVDRLVCLVSLASWGAAAQPVVLQGELPDEGPDFVLVPVEVPAGVVELEVAHPAQQSENILDYGLRAPSGAFRGWGGGNAEPLVVGLEAASRSYLPGPMSAGVWHVIIGKAKVVAKPARYRLEVQLRDAPTLAPQTMRRPFTPPAPLSAEARWYAGDFHVHSRESGDAQPDIDAIATFARGRGLDFVELADHNTTSQLDFLGDAQPRHPRLLLLPGVEFTTYGGHANGIGATAYVPHTIGLDGADVEGAAEAFRQQGAVFSINHPVLDLGLACIGCAWKHPIPAALGGVEIGTGGWDKTGILFTGQAIAWWDRLVGRGRHLAALGGSDDHQGGQGTGMFDSPIGNPTTLVFASSLSVDGVVAAVREGRTVVKLQGPGDPMVDIVTAAGATASEAPAGVTTLIGRTLTSTASTVPFGFRVTGGDGTSLRVVVDGVALTPVDIAGDDVLTVAEVEVPASGERRVRAEVWVDGAPRTVTSHAYLLRGEDVEPRGCGCTGVPGPFVLAALAALAWRRRFGRARVRPKT